MNERQIKVIVIPDNPTARGRIGNKLGQVSIDITPFLISKDLPETKWDPFKVTKIQPASK